MDSNNEIQSSVGPDHFFSTSPHFFDPLPAFLDSHAFAAAAAPNTSFSLPQPTIATAAATATTTTAGPTRPSRKRSRASRRAPTTVLTTDTSNFRAMVQEFTGIPAPPFPTSSSSSASASAAAASLHFPRFRRFLQSPSSASPPLPPAVSFQSLLRSQLLDPPHPPTASTSGELRLPGVIGSGGDPIPNSFKIDFPVTTTTSSAADQLHADKASDGLMEPWICSSD